MIRENYVYKCLTHINNITKHNITYIYCIKMYITFIAHIPNTQRHAIYKEEILNVVYKKKE